MFYFHRRFCLFYLYRNAKYYINNLILDIRKKECYFQGCCVRAIRCIEAYLSLLRDERKNFGWNFRNASLVIFIKVLRTYFKCYSLMLYINRIVI